MTSRNKHAAGPKPAAPRRDERTRDPKLPHERDETVPDADSAQAASQPGHEVMRRAHDGVEGGKQDTSRSQEADRTYHELRKPK